MAVESYVEVTCAVVERAYLAIGASPSHFWDWLGNVYFLEDDHRLSPARAHEIRMSIHTLLEKFQKVVNDADN